MVSKRSGGSVTRISRNIQIVQGFEYYKGSHHLLLSMQLY